LVLDEGLEGKRQLQAQLCAVHQQPFLQIVLAMGARVARVYDPAFDTRLAIKFGAVGADVGWFGFGGAQWACQYTDEGKLLGGGTFGGVCWPVFQGHGSNTVKYI
jgi:hypothetical protein